MVEIYGHSDDCIEVDGGLLQEEFYIREEGSFLRFPDGLVVRCTFCAEDNEAWRFRVVRNPANVRIEEQGPDDHEDYRLVVHADYPSVDHDATEDGPDNSQIRDELDRFDAADYSNEERRAIFNFLRQLRVKEPTP